MRLSSIKAKKRWNAARDFGEMIAVGDSDSSRVPDSQQITEKYEMVPVMSLPEVGWPDDLRLRIGLSLMRSVTLGDQTDWLVENGRELNEILSQPGGNASFQIVIEYIFISEGNEEKVVEALEKTPPEIEKRAMSVAEILEERGLKRGLEKGLEKGRQEGREEAQTKLILAMLRNGMTSQEIAKQTGLKLATVAQVEADL